MSLARGSNLPLDHCTSQSVPVITTICSQPLHNVLDNSEVNKSKEDRAVNNWNIKMSVTYSTLTTGKWLFPCTANGT